MTDRKTGTRGRVLVAAFMLEADTFAPGATTIDDYRGQVFVVGAEIRHDSLGPNNELAAAWSVLEAAGHEIVPALAAWSTPAPPLAPEALAEIIRLAVAPADDTIDGAYVQLHGAATAHGEDDPEGALLAALRDRLGPDRPIAISLDCHANLTPRMLGAVDAIAAYHTCPHVDTARTGAQAASILRRALDGSARPVVAMAGRPMITPPERHNSALEPFHRLMALADVAEAEGALSAGLLPVQPWIDVPGLGWKAFATADGDRARAAAWAERIVAEAWRERRAFLGISRATIDEALALALAGPAPYVIADAGDSPNGGSVGDSTELLRAALRAGEGDGAAGGRIVLSILDPAAAAAAYRAGAGATLELTLAAGPPDAYNAATPVVARVARAFDVEFAYTHPVNAGYRATTGPAALLEIGRVAAIVHTRRVNVIDPALYEVAGAAPAAAAVLQAKSHVSYRAGFARLTERSVVADTPGPTTANITRLPFTRRPRPLFPFEDPPPTCRHRAAPPGPLCARRHPARLGAARTVGRQPSTRAPRRWIEGGGSTMASASASQRDLDSAPGSFLAELRRPPRGLLAHARWGFLVASLVLIAAVELAATIAAAALGGRWPLALIAPIVLAVVWIDGDRRDDPSNSRHPQPRRRHGRRRRRVLPRPHRARGLPARDRPRAHPAPGRRRARLGDGPPARLRRHRQRRPVAPRLRERGKIRAYGISTNSLAVLRRFDRDGTCATCQIGYNILNRDAERDILPYCRENDIGTLIRGPLAKGVLTGKFTRGTRFDDDARSNWSEGEGREQFVRMVERADRLHFLERPGRTMGQAALQWILANPAVSCVIPGAKNVLQIRANAAAADADLSPEENARVAEALR